MKLRLKLIGEDAPIPMSNVEAAIQVLTVHQFLDGGDACLEGETGQGWSCHCHLLQEGKPRFRLLIYKRSSTMIDTVYPKLHFATDIKALADRMESGSNPDIQFVVPERGRVHSDGQIEWTPF